VAFNDARQLPGAGLFGACPGGKFTFQIRAIRLGTSRASRYFLTRSMTAWLMPTAAMRSVSGLDSVHGVHGSCSFTLSASKITSHDLALSFRMFTQGLGGLSLAPRKRIGARKPKLPHRFVGSCNKLNLEPQDRGAGRGLLTSSLW
jgi:hypothetical protein